ncbi:MAG: DUF2085 domain-containing protein [Thermoplasmata archaeon]
MMSREFWRWLSRLSSGTVQRGFHPLVLIPAAITLIWALLNVLAPLSLPPGSVTGLSGSVGVIDNGELTAHMNPLAKAIYESGDVNCHQRADRSIFINGNQMPYCARCTGIFLGLALGTALSLYFVVELRLWQILLGLGPLGLDGGGQLLGLWESTNPVRIVTGALAGGVTGIALGYIFFVLESFLGERLGRRAAGLGGVKRAPPRPQDAEDNVRCGDEGENSKPDGLEGGNAAEVRSQDNNKER